MVCHPEPPPEKWKTLHLSLGVLNLEFKFFRLCGSSSVSVKKMIIIVLCYGPVYDDNALEKDKNLKILR